jgi:hypothetical protein
MKVDSLFWGGGGLSAFSKAEFEVFYFLFKPPVCDMKNFYTIIVSVVDLDPFPDRIRIQCGTWIRIHKHC